MGIVENVSIKCLVLLGRVFLHQRSHICLFGCCENLCREHVGCSELVGIITRVITTPQL